MGIRLQWKNNRKSNAMKSGGQKNQSNLSKSRKALSLFHGIRITMWKLTATILMRIRGLNESGKDIAHSADIQLIAPKQATCISNSRVAVYLFWPPNSNGVCFFESRKIYCPEILGCLWMDNSCGAPVEQTMYLDAAAQGGKTIKYKSGVSVKMAPR